MKIGSINFQLQDVSQLQAIKPGAPMLKGSADRFQAWKRIGSQVCEPILRRGRFFLHQCGHSAPVRRAFCGEILAWR
ncbi:hypothetical protein AMC94_12705 [Pseudomonas amygdali pv. aesculi]|nr:hypothetical protein AL041_13855 [Pseudomonas amygdali pv. aesculi]KWT19456.1 hypothetical protein AL044_00265 [Pseudomonas amygdali pv. aesculi]KWT27162.1 hypothetical protein AL042_13650 [Pseudomonas amygdali pv. aesculi]KWT29699.1 hypothetical protein AL043_12680 [Pseudomonas amygdali pv. aesculi]KWT40473.1 hypothetical protein AL045_15240 [Pseudomonas amygdali pv. aesculi]